MKSLEKIFTLCAAEGVQLELVGTELELSFDNEISDVLMEELRASKEQIIAYLQDYESHRDNTWLIPIRSVDNTEPQPLSYSQRRLWFIEQFEPGSTQYNLPAVYLFEGDFDVDAAEHAINQIIDRHQILKTRFFSEQGEGMQQVWSAPAFAFGQYDVSATVQPEEAARSKLNDLISQPFDLSAQLPVSGVLIYTKKNKGILAFTMHHMVTDGWSLGIFVREFVSLYLTRQLGEAENLKTLPFQYHDYAAWQRQQLQKETLEPKLFFWQRQLADLPDVHSLPTDYPRPAQQSFSGRIYRCVLSDELSNSLKSLAHQHSVTLFILIHTLFSCILAKYSGQKDVVIGTPVANRLNPEIESLIGYFANTVVLRCQLENRPFSELLQQVAKVHLQALEYQDVPFEMLVERLSPKRTASYTPLFQIMLAMNNTAAVPLSLPSLSLQPMTNDRVVSKFDLTLNIRDTSGNLEFEFEYAADLFSAQTIENLASSVVLLAEQMVANTDVSFADLNVLNTTQQHWIDSRLKNHIPCQNLCLTSEISSVPQMIAQRTRDISSRIALTFGKEAISFQTLETRANQLAHLLIDFGVVPGDGVAVMMKRGIDLVVSLLAVLKTGAYYIPLDPDYPKSRLKFMLEDCNSPWLLCRKEPKFANAVQVINLTDSATQTALLQQPEGALASRVKPTDLAYMIYTSGSTGQPKGVMISHENVLTFLAGISHHLAGSAGTWLALTSVSFDISVLEIFGALAEGFHVVIAGERGISAQAEPESKAVGFSLFYFGNDSTQHGQAYQLLIEGAKLADQNGFEAVWTPERHFAEFGGMFPNPAITGATVAAVTQHIGIRAGSCVLPLHDPVAIAEDWSLLDNLSNGRVGLAFASGWNVNDFVTAPEAYRQRSTLLENGIEEFSALWRGEKISRQNGVGQSVDFCIHPKPKQALPPLWITAAGNPDTFVRAGTLGCNLLTHMLGQTLGELKEKIDLYRQAWQQAGHPGIGKVTLTLHTYVGETDEQAKAMVEAPFKRYLATSLNLLNSVRDEESNLDEAQIIDVAFNRYYKTATLFGSSSRCRSILQKITALGIDEIACLIDFGLEFDEAMDGLARLVKLKQEYNSQQNTVPEQISLEQLINQHNVTHLQCTPSFLSSWLDSIPSMQTFPTMQTVFVGGEAFPAALYGQIKARMNVTVLNMYGPTETTVWSGCKILDDNTPVALGLPLPGYRYYIVDAELNLVPPGAVGELLISGAALSQGYYQRPELTHSRFISNPFSQQQGFERCYCTGDLVRLDSQGELLYLGRIDHQVKLRGFRIECGEIEAHLEQCEVVGRAVVMVFGDSEHQLLVAYVVAAAGMAIEETETLKALLSKQLPDYMMPDRIIVLPSFPQTANGKVDRKALPTPSQCIDQTIIAAPTTEMEIRLAEIWSILLKIDNAQIGCESNFFDLGGHSLLLMRLTAEIQSHFNVTLSVRDAFHAPTLSLLAKTVVNAQEHHAQIETFTRLTEIPAVEGEELIVI